MLPKKITKIIATIGPSSNTESVLTRMIQKGLDVVRLNASHSKDKEDLINTIQMVKDISDKLGHPVGMFLDLQGPKFRVGEFEDGEIYLKKNHIFKLVSNTKVLSNEDVISIGYPEVISDIKDGDHLFIDDGKVKVKVIKKEKGFATCRVLQGGVVSNNKGVNLPNTETSLSILTDKDKEDIEIAVKYKLDYVGLSFVSNAKEIHKVRKYIQKLGGKNLGIIAKVERNTAVENIVEIIEATDIIMVARGDLGVEVGIEKVPAIQKMIIRESNKHIKPVIVATQMLEGMITSRSATRAEVSDVANAIYDKCDAVMLSGETAIGIDPVNVIETMVNICSATDEQLVNLKRMKFSQVKKVFHDKSKATSFCKAADQIAEENEVDLMLAFTSSGNTALIASKLNPSIPIVAPTDQVHIRNRMTFYRGVIPFLMTKKFADINGWTPMIESALKYCLENKIVKINDTVIVTAGIPIGISGGTNSIRLIQVQ